MTVHSFLKLFSLGVSESSNVCICLTDKEAQAVDKMGTNCVDGGDASVFNRLSVQNQQVQAEALCSLQHMRQQRAQLQASLRQQRHTSGGNTTLHHNGVRKSIIYQKNERREPVLGKA